MIKEFFFKKKRKNNERNKDKQDSTATPIRGLQPFILLMKATSHNTRAGKEVVHEAHMYLLYFSLWQKIIFLATANFIIQSFTARTSFSG